MRRNLLYVITKLELGGAQKHLLGLIRGLDKEQYNIFLFTAKDGLLADEAGKISGLTLVRSRSLERPLNPFKDALALFELYNFIKNNNIDIVHTHSSKAGILGRLAGRLAKVSFIAHTVHGWSFNDYQPFFLRWMYLWLERLVGAFTDKLIVVCESDKEKGLSHRVGCQDKYALIRYGINYEEFGPAGQGVKLREELGIGQEVPVAGMISCFKPQKAPGDFIRLARLVAQDMPDARFILAGDGALRQEIEALISEYNLEKQVVLLGWRRDIPEILSAMDVFVLTSLWEGLPIALLEAMASARPAVVTDTGGVREVISEDRAGFLVLPGDIKAMAAKVRLLLSDRTLRLKMGEGARKALGQDFCLKDMVDNIQRIYMDADSQC